MLDERKFYVLCMIQLLYIHTYIYVMHMPQTEREKERKKERYINVFYGQKSSTLSRVLSVYIFKSSAQSDRRGLSVCLSSSLSFCSFGFDAGNRFCTKKTSLQHTIVSSRCFQFLLLFMSTTNRMTINLASIYFSARNIKNSE